MKKILYSIIFLFVLAQGQNVFARAVLLPPEGDKIYFGAFPDFGGSEETVTGERIANFEELAQKQVVWAPFSVNWLNGITYPQDKVHEIADHGAFPYMRLMPRSDFEEGHAETVYSLQKIIDGEFDADLHQMAIGVREDNIPIGVDFAVEPTGNWFGWSGVFNGGGTTDQYGDPAYPDGPERWRDAYRHIINIFRTEGADNVTFFFHPDIQRLPDEEWNSAKYYYPGDEYIDWIGFSIYGALIPDPAVSEWRLFSDMWEEQHSLIMEISSSKPIAILEFGVTDDYPAEDKSAWLSDAFSTILDNPYVDFKAINYWHENWENEDTGEPDTTLRIDSSSTTLSTFRSLVANSRFVSEKNILTQSAVDNRFDVNDDKKLSSVDALLVERKTSGQDMALTEWSEATVVGDVNCDGVVDNEDTKLSLRKSLDLDMNGKGWCQNDDKKAIYRNNDDIAINISDNNVIIQRQNDGKVLLDTTGGEFFVDRSGGNVIVDYNLIEKNGGFDIKYVVQNATTEAQSMPDFHVPGVNLNEGNLDILNTYKMYLEEGRELTDDANYNGHSDNRFDVGLYHGSYTLSGDQVNGRDYCEYDSDNDITICRYIENIRYKGGATSSYAPVIVAKDGSFAVGSALEYPFLEYNYDTSSYGGSVSTYKDPNYKLYPFMRILKTGSSWTYEYSFIHYQSPSEQADGYIPANTTYYFTIPVRFSSNDKWLLTLYPYKDYLNEQYSSTTSPQRVAKPVLWANLAFYGIYDEQNNNPRQWSYNWQMSDDGSPIELDLGGLTAGLSSVMNSHGYEDVMLHSLSGLYPVSSGHSMYSEIPNQFISGRPDYLKGGVLSDALQTFKDAGQKYSFWWGISGSIPVDDSDNVISYDTWLPDKDIPFKLNDSSHKDYATYQLNQALNFEPSGIGYDAYGRMEEKSAINWLDEMKGIIKSSGNTTQMWLEAMQDIKHKKAAIIRQGYTDWREINHNAITDPPVLAQYLNPEAEIMVILGAHAMSELNGTTPEEHIQEVIKMGYTPFVTNKESLVNNPSYNNLTEKVIGNSNAFYDLSGLEKNVYTCFDGIDNDGDGKVDWPRDESCVSPTEDSE